MSAQDDEILRLQRQLADVTAALTELVACADEEIWDGYIAGTDNRRVAAAWSAARVALASSPADAN